MPCHRKRISNFLLVINSNFGRISYRFQDINTFSIKPENSLFSPTAPLFDAPLAKESVTYNLYTTEKHI